MKIRASIMNVILKVCFVHFSLLANEIMWHVVRGLVDLLPLEFQQAEDKYRKDTTGFTFPRWQTCNILTDGLFRFVTTLLYANKHLSEDARTTVSI